VADENGDAFSLTHLVDFGLQERRDAGPDAVLDAPDGTLGAAYRVRDGRRFAPGERVVAVARRSGRGVPGVRRLHEHVLVHVKTVILVGVVHVDDPVDRGVGRVAVTPLLDSDNRRRRRRSFR